MTDSEQCKHDLVRGVWCSDGDHYVACARCNEKLPQYICEGVQLYTPLYTQCHEIIGFAACRQHVQRHALYTANDAISCVLFKFDNDKAMEDWEKKHPSWARVWWR